MRKIKEKRMQSYVLRARKMVQEGKNKEDYYDVKLPPIYESASL